MALSTEYQSIRTPPVGSGDLLHSVQSKNHTWRGEEGKREREGYGREPLRPRGKNRLFRRAADASIAVAHGFLSTNLGLCPCCLPPLAHIHLDYCSILFFFFFSFSTAARQSCGNNNKISERERGIAKHRIERQKDAIDYSIHA